MADHNSPTNQTNYCEIKKKKEQTKRVRCQLMY